MKRLWSVGIFLFTCIYALSAHAIVLSDIEGQSPAVWGISENNKRFVPRKGGIKVCKAENQIIIGFYLSEENIEFYNQRFPDGNRKPIGFEFDIKDTSHVFNRKDLIEMEPSFQNNLRYDENYQEDNDYLYTVGINDPTKLSPNTWHTVTIIFSKHVDVSIATFEVNVQLVGDARKLRDDYHDIYNGYGVDVEMQFATWFNTWGKEDVDGNNYFGILPSKRVFYADHFFGWPEGIETGYDRYLWDMLDPRRDGGQIGDYQPYSCDFGSDPWETADGESPTQGNIPSLQIPPEIINPGVYGGGGMNDMKIESVNMSKGAKSERHSTLKQDPGEKFYAYAKLDNDGSAVAYDFKLKFYIDGGKRSFDRDDEDYHGSIRIDEYQPEAEIRYAKELTAPQTPGIYWVYACVTSLDYDEDEDNNCSDEDSREEYGKLIVGDVVEPMPNLIVSNLVLTASRTTLSVGDRYGLMADITNIGQVTPATGTRVSYEIKGPGTKNQWTYITDDGSDANELSPGRVQREEISQGFGAVIPSVPGTYYARACADYQNSVEEEKEDDNCRSVSFSVTKPQPPSVTITEPRAGVTWKSDKKQDIKWVSSNLPWGEPIVIQFLCKGQWHVIYDGYTKNDGTKHWEVKKNRTKDDRGARIRIIKQSTGQVLGESAPFYLDHKKGTPEL